MTGPVRKPRVGDLVRIGRRASVQFDDGRDLLARVVGTHPPRDVYDTFQWVEVYVLDPETGQAVARRSVYVQPAGLEYLEKAARPRPVQPSRETRQQVRRFRNQSTTGLGDEPTRRRASVGDSPRWQRKAAPRRPGVPCPRRPRRRGAASPKPCSRV